jgi:hypothetical protein
MRSLLDETLPGFEDYLKKDTRAAGWIAEQEAKINAAARDDDDILLERALGSWTKAVGRVNEIIAEEYRLSHPDPELWELRFVKWMTKITYIRFESPMGEFYVVPRMPKRRPKAAHWYTVDEMIDMMHPAVAETIKAFGVLPVRPEALPGPAPGEKHLLIDATGKQVVMKYDFQGGTRHGRRNVR